MPLPFRRSNSLPGSSGDGARPIAMVGGPLTRCGVEDSPKTGKRQWPQFTLKTMLISIAVIAVIIGYCVGAWFTATVVAIFTLAVIEGPLTPHNFD
jgi:hypothetical protein